MEKKIEIPKDVNIIVEGMRITVKGKKGETTRNFSDPRYNHSISMKKEGSTIIVSSESGRKKIKAMIGTIISHIKNMIDGASKGHTYIIKINSTHFPMNIEVKGGTVIIKNFIGERGIRKSAIRKNVRVEVQKDNIIIKGVDKEDVAQTAANIEMATRLTKKDRRIFGDGCFLESSFVGD
ncbi:MAG: 50S ribosomal protein L6 [Candidatus Aenigmarchaeota archaeon]|nr:50S ribosomal protein L6 [Candidatus Aenigmarchaeota archaeon]